MSGVDHNRLEALYQEHRHVMWNAAVHLCGDRAIAEDVVQDVFVALAGLAHEVEHPRTYLLRSVVRRVRVALLRASVHDTGDDVAAAESGRAATPDVVLAQTEQAAAVASALAGLPLVQREVVVLHAFENLSFRAIADLCGVSPNTVASRWRYACAALRTTLHRQGIAP